MSDDKMGKLTYLTVKACQAGGSFWVVQEAVASTALSHPEWDLVERRSFAEWVVEDGPSESSTSDAQSEIALQEGEAS